MGAPAHDRSKPVARIALERRVKRAGLAGFVAQPLPEGDWHNVAGYVIGALDEIPSAGDSIHTEVGEFAVIEMDGYASATLRVKLSSGVADANVRSLS